MQSSSRAQYLCMLCQELRAIVGDAPRDDGPAREQSQSILKQLRADPYASGQTHERLRHLTGALERWLSSALAPRELHELRESILLELAHIETEQRLRSWLMEIVR